MPTRRQVLKVQVHGRYSDIQKLNQYASDLKHASPVTAESLNPQVQEINERWDGLEAALHDREVSTSLVVLLPSHLSPPLCGVDVSYETPPFSSVLCFLPRQSLLPQVHIYTVPIHLRFDVPFLFFPGTSFTITLLPTLHILHPFP